MANENEIKVGDVVELKSGGPQMTVNSILDGDAECRFFNGNVPNWIEVSVHSLKKIN